jgi:hypothetical protein
MCDIKWITTNKEMPKCDKLIAVLLNSEIGGNGKWPDSYEIVFGRTYQQVRHGKMMMYIKSNFIGDTPVTDAAAWAPAKEFDKPEFMERKR